MTQNNRETLQRAIGIIEGISYAASTRVQDALAIACDMLDSVLKDEEEHERSDDIGRTQDVYKKNN
jgi:hypothetical protein